MKKSRKLTALLLVAMLVLSSLSLAGCGSNEGLKQVKASDEPTASANATASASPENRGEPVTLTVYSQLANYSGEQIGWFARVMLDKFNVKLNIVPDSDGMFVTRMESGDLGDIVIFGSDKDEYIEAVSKGMLLDWNQDNLLQEYGPFMYENMQKAFEKNAEISKADGKVYGFGHGVAPTAEDHQSFFYYSDLRWDLYKQLGYPEINTLEDFIEVLADMKEICPVSDNGKETYGVSLFTDWDGDMVMYVKATTALYGWDEMGIGLYHPETQEWQCCLDEGGMYLRSLSFYNQLYRRNLLHPDSMTHGFQGASEHYQDGVAFWTIFSFCGSAAYNTEAHKAEGKAMYPKIAKDMTPITYGLNVFGGNRVWAIGAKTQYPELCMEIINWLCTPEGVMTYNHGPKGVTWDYDENKEPYLTELGRQCKADKKTELPAPYGGTWGDGSFQMNNTTWVIDAKNPETNGLTYNHLFWPSWNATEKWDILEDWRAYTGFTTQDQYLESFDYVVSPGSTYAMSPKSDELAITWEQVINTIKDYSWRAIYAKTDDEFNSIVAEMREKAIAYGLQDCIDFMETEVQRRIEAENAVKK